LAIAEALVRLRPETNPVLVGARRGVEARILPNRQFRHYLLPAEPIYRRDWWKNLRWPILLPGLLRACRDILDRELPVLVVGTGGYAAGPILAAAVGRGLPIALQEQNAKPGLTTRLLARRARQLHLGFPEAESRLRPGSRTAVYSSGNPIVPPEDIGRADARRRLGLGEEQQVVLVMGGSQGAHALNRALREALADRGFGSAAVLWSTGPNDFDRFRSLASSPLVQIRPFWDPIAEAYAAADLVVARAGAMTTAELAAWGLPSILVPLPTAAADHQTANALALEGAGAAVHLPESALTVATLTSQVHDLLNSPTKRSQMADAARSRARPEAAKQIAERLFELVSWARKSFVDKELVLY
jgi:UDP-N-acetylglucosamine--N-acetylmuramyl-(pentapeptide) pyrophosphoryl-undecaprenol N-acetylglucosamine transferase